MNNAETTNTGHGHVRPRPDGVKARCGGPAMCRVCKDEAAALAQPQPSAPTETSGQRAAWTAVMQALDEVSPGWCKGADTPMSQAVAAIRWMAQPSVPSAEPPFDMLAHLKRQAEFSAKTFGPGARVEGVTDHIAKELREVRESGGDLSEWVDVIILAFDGAWRSGASPAQIIDAMVAKQTKNEGRKWPDWRTAPAGKAIEHDRSGEVGAAPLMANGLTEAETADTRKLCTCDGAGRGPGRACVVKAGQRLGELWRCADGIESQAATSSVGGAYLYVYEYDTPFGLHRELYPRPYNGASPTRTVPLYVAAQAAPVSAPADEQAAFEAWAAEEKLALNRHRHSYAATSTAWCWDAWKAARASAPAVAAPEPIKPDGRLHSDGYFTWARRDGYAMDKRLPCDFYLAAPTVKDSLTVATQPSAAPLPAREPTNGASDAV